MLGMVSYWGQVGRKRPMLLDEEEEEEEVLPQVPSFDTQKRAGITHDDTT